MCTHPGCRSGLPCIFATLPMQTTDAIQTIEYHACTAIGLIEPVMSLCFGLGALVRSLLVDYMASQPRSDC